MNPWILREHPNSLAKLRLFALPFAGGNASVFSGWGESLPSAVECCAIQLPGRQNRLRANASAADAVCGECGSPLETEPSTSTQSLMNNKAARLFRFPDRLGRSKTVHDRHLHIHQDNIKVTILDRLDCLGAVVRHRDFMTKSRKHTNGEFLVDRIVLCQKDF